MSGPGYQVIARKWRPQRFADVVGQRAVVRTLSNALAQGRVAHAYCFSGIRGVGKTTAARLLAKGLNCRESASPTAEPCGRCESCLEIEASRSLDVVELDAASQTGVDNIRELTEVTRYAPSRDRHRVFIIDEAHMLSTQAFNALLKTLEEPPPHVVFILATTEPNKILPTVLSRCQHYQFGRLSQGEIVGHLGRIAAAEGVQISADGLALLATAADGSLRDGQSLLDKLIAFAGDSIDEGTVIDLLGLIDRVLLFRATDLIIAGDVAGAIRFVEEMVESGVDLHQFAVDLLGHVRNLLVVRTVPEPGPILHLPEGDLARLREQAEAFSVDDLDRAFSLIAASEYRLKMAEQPRYHLELVLARLARMPSLEPIEELLAALQGEPGGSASPRGSGGGGDKRAATGGARSAPRRGAGTATTGSGEPPAEPAQAAIPGPATTVTTVTTARAEPARGPQPADDGLPVPSLLRRIQERVEVTHPMIAQLLGRSGGISLSGERLALQFPASAGIFVERLRDPEVIRLLTTAAEEVTGRKVVVRVETAAPEELGAAAVSSSPGAPETERPTPQAPRAGPASASQGDPDPGLRQRAEQEPLVQEFVKALKGQIVTVEEIADP